MKQFNDHLPVGLLAQLVRALHQYHRGQGSNPGKAQFFRLSSRNCITCVFNYDDLLCSKSPITSKREVYLFCLVHPASVAEEKNKIQS